MDKSSVIFGNAIDKKTIKRANKSKRKYIKKYGDDSNKDYRLSFVPIDTLDFIGAQKVVFGADGTFADNALIVGNIRMGFGHYRISIAMASCAHALGYTPCWLDLASFDATGSKMIRAQNDLYSLASRISQKSKLFNALVWEPMNSEGFKKITYNAVDQKNSELLVPIFKNIDKDIPYIATHVWPSQAAVHAGMNNVVNAIPDNWPMGLHLSEGAIHAVQTPFAYLGYKTLDGFAKKPLNGIPENQLKMVGRFIDHELLVDLEGDNRRRIERVNSGKPLRLLLTVGGAGAGFDMFAAMVKHLKPYVEAKKVALFINFGDHREVCDKLVKATGIKSYKTYFNDYDGLKKLVADIRDGDADGVYAVYNDDIFRAVYSTNLLMPVCDLLVTKPSELAYYPIPKIFMKHIGGHEVYGAINGRELGDSLNEYPTAKSLNAMLDKVLSDKEIIPHLCDRITELKSQGYYDGAYECVKLATGKK
ncbi:MAG: hypothetical protein J1G04_04230 [Clostridiales bacterium]|nr:hypothetical protein [Clostridiales bacterium]